MRVQYVVLRTQNNKLSGLVGGNQHRCAKVMQQGGNEGVCWLAKGMLIGQVYLKN